MQTGNWKKKGKEMKIKDAIKKIRIEPLIVNLLSAYALGSSAMLLYVRIFKGVKFSSLEFTANAGFITAGCVIAGLFALLTVLRHFVRNDTVFRLLMFCCVSVYFALLCYDAFNVWFCLILMVLCAVAAHYCFGTKELRLKPRRIPVGVLAAAGAGVMFVFLAVETCLRYRNMAAEHYDMGVYAQVFDSLAKTGATLLRTADAETYRFDTAPSPLLYPLTVLWMLFHSMTPYLVLQAAALASGVFPLHGIMRTRGMSEKTRLCAVCVYFLFPGIWNAAFYDFHEQCFLVPLVLWTLYFLERKKIVPFALCALLTAAVGAEGAVIVLFIAIYAFFMRKERIAGLAALIPALLALIFCLLTAKRLFVPDNSVYGNAKFFEFLLKDPGYLLKSVFSEEKIGFVVLMFASLGCLPFMTKDRGQLILLVPVLILNLLGADYDASVGYQHAFGAAALTLYVFLGALDTLKGRKKQMAAAFCVLACLLTFCGQILPRAHYVRDNGKNAELRRAKTEALSMIPYGADVTASSEFTAFLTDCGEIRVYFQPEVDAEGNVIRECRDVYSTEYTILDLSGAQGELNALRAARLLTEGFREVYLKEGAVAVLQNN